MHPEWNRDLIWSKQDARLRRRRSLTVMGIVFALGIGLGVANQACYELIQRADRPATRIMQSIPAPDLGR